MSPLKCRIDIWSAAFICVCGLGFAAVSTPANSQSRDSTKIFGSDTTPEELVEALSYRPDTEGLTIGSKSSGSRRTRRPPAMKPRVALKVNFAFDSARLLPEAKTLLDKLATAINSQRLGADRFVLAGHTDGLGSSTYNLGLSQRRAMAVRNYLTREHSIPPTRLRPVGRGEQELIDPTDPANGDNRRVEVINSGR